MRGQDHRIVEFFNERHPDPHDSSIDGSGVDGPPFEDGMFRFEKQMGVPA